MWKESYRIGVELVDGQHKQLFEMVDSLVKTVSDDSGWESKKEGCKKAITFMKDYVVMHFAAEEGYQEEIGYEGREAHKKLHQQFTAEVLEFEKKLVESDFDSKVAKQFAGILTAWLINHVALEDQKIVHGEREAGAQVAGSSDTVIDSFVQGVADTLGRMVGVDIAGFNEKPMGKSELLGDIFAKIGIVGDMEGHVTYGYSEDFALKAVSLMTMMDINEVDDFVCSAMAEISNIISGGTTISLCEKGYNCDITSPEITIGTSSDYAEDLQAKMCVGTPIGQMMVAANLTAK